MKAGWKQNTFRSFGARRICRQCSTKCVRGREENHCTWFSPLSLTHFVLCDSHVLYVTLTPNSRHNDPSSTNVITLKSIPLRSTSFLLLHVQTLRFPSIQLPHRQTPNSCVLPCLQQAFTRRMIILLQRSSKDSECSFYKIQLCQ